MNECHMDLIHKGERLNGYSHLAATLLAVAGGTYLLGEAATAGNALHIAGVAIFVFCAVVLYAVSTLYHSARGAARAAWERADHCAIYLLVAGSHTPFALMGAQGPVDWVVPGFMWALAWYGIRSEFSREENAAPPLWIYVGMGWTAVAGAALFASHLSFAVTGWLLAGAVVYSAGTVFYRNRTGWAHAHGAWHVFVMCGSACHFVAIGEMVRLSG